MTDPLFALETPAAGVASPRTPAGGPRHPTTPETAPVQPGEGLAGAVPGLVITVYGKPITQGSKVKGRYGMWDDNAKTLKPWRDNVRSAALEFTESEGYERIDGAVAVSIVFTFDRPAIHWRTGRNAHMLREGAPVFPTNVKSGDIDKLQRSCFDSLTDAGVWRDDAQVVRVEATKFYVGADNCDALDRPGAVIRVRAIT